MLRASLCQAPGVKALSTPTAAGPWSKEYTRLAKAHILAYPTLSGLLGAQVCVCVCVWVHVCR
jgi:hypothetical protein